MRLFSAPLVSLCAFISLAAAQTPASRPDYIADEQIVVNINQIGQRAARIEPMLQQLHPNDWVAKGASDTYVAQWNSLLQQYKAVQLDMSALAQHPSMISESMKALFRIQTAHRVLDSLMAGTRKYQNPALADLIESVAAETNNDTDRLQQYLVQTTEDREQQFSVVDHEAQRCRATLSRQPATPARPNRKN